MTNKTRFVPAGFKEFKPNIPEYPEGMFQVFLSCDTNTASDPRPTAIFYTGKQSHHTWYNRFNTVDDMKKKINDTISRLMAWEDKKAERKEKRKAPTTYKKGDIFYSSWGYDQTNVNFYQVIGTKGKQTLELKEIASSVVSSDGGPTTHVTAVPGKFLNDKVLTKRASGKYINITDYATGFPWDGKPKYETASGWGH